MKILVLDFETRDGGLENSVGPGWIFGSIKEPNPLFKTIGYSYCIIENSICGPSNYVSTLNEPFKEGEFDFLDEYDYIAFHNAQYDLGCLIWHGYDLNKLKNKILDTKIIAQLYDNNLWSYSLDPLLERYCGDKKAKNRLLDVILEHKLGGFKGTNKTFESRAAKWAYNHMDLLQELDFQAMADYANQDTQGTAKLLLYLLARVPLEQASYFSDCQRICTNLRKRGRRIDMHAIQHGIDLLTPIVSKLELKLYDLFNERFDILSPKQLRERMAARGYKLPKTDKNNDSVPKEWLLEQDDEICKTLANYRETNKLLRDFFIAPKDLQQFMCPEALVAGAKYGRVYPELNLFGARTGRFSSSNPNEQQIPKRNETYGPLCRAIFVPNDETKKWIHLDYSNQEGRLQVHYAALLNAPKIELLVNKFKKNPSFDMHQDIADLVGVTRKEAKGINLGLSYGMGIGKLSKTLKCSVEQAETKRDQYNERMPFLKTLADECKKRIKSKGFIKTIGGRILRREPPQKDYNFDYKALNKLIQGSAACQGIMALKAADDTGLDLINMVHDEFNLEGTLEDGLKMKHIMENAVQLKIPVVAEIEIGDSWGTLMSLGEYNEQLSSSTNLAK